MVGYAKEISDAVPMKKIPTVQDPPIRSGSACLTRALIVPDLLVAKCSSAYKRGTSIILPVLIVRADLLTLAPENLLARDDGLERQRHQRRRQLARCPRQSQARSLQFGLIPKGQDAGGHDRHIAMQHCIHAEEVLRRCVRTAGRFGIEQIQ